MSFGQPPQDAIDAAIDEAKLSPCAKSQRGCAIYSAAENLPWKILGQGFNAPPGGDCDGSPGCRSICNKLCAHAELNAVLMALRAVAPPYTRADLELVHVQLVDGELIAGGPPSCWSCANLIAASGVWAVWLYEDLYEGPRWTRWLAPMFLRSTLKRQHDHWDHERRNGIELPCSECAKQEGAKRDVHGKWHCNSCGSA